MFDLPEILGFALGGPIGAAAGFVYDQSTQSPALTNANGDQLSDADQAILSGVVDPAKKSQMLMNWLVGPKPKPVNPGEEFARSEKMAGVIAKADAGKGMGGLFGMGLLVGDTAPNLSLPVGQPGQEPSAGPIINLTPEAPAGQPTSPWTPGGTPAPAPWTPGGGTPAPPPKAPWTPGGGK